MEGSLEQLQNYLEVETSQVRGAIAAPSMLTPVANSTKTDDINSTSSRVLEFGLKAQSEKKY